MTLYDLLRAFRTRGDDRAYETFDPDGRFAHVLDPWKIALRGARESVSPEFRFDDAEQFESLVRTMFVVEFATQHHPDGADWGTSIEQRLHSDLLLNSRDGAAYRILADIYREFPDAVDAAFPVEVA